MEEAETNNTDAGAAEAAPATATATLRLAGRDYTPEAPAQVSERYDVVLAFETLQGHRAAALAVALCWPVLRRRMRNRKITYTGDAGTYGGKVFDYLISQGAQYVTIILAGDVALDLCMAGLPGIDALVDEGARAALVGKSDDGEG